MKGDRPKQPHYQVIWDAYQQVGRTEVSDLIEEVLQGLRTEERMFPDLYAHKVTDALIKAGFIPADAPTGEPPEVLTPRGWRWVSCSMDVNLVTAQHRHLIEVGPNPRRPLRTGTTLCGVSSLGAGIWRRDVRKPACPHCVRVLGKRGGVGRMT